MKSFGQSSYQGYEQENWARIVGVGQALGRCSQRICLAARRPQYLTTIVIISGKLLSRWARILVQVLLIDLIVARRHRSLLPVT